MTEKLVRCAVYTRKSSEEGLEQSFNSLDAQREACEAFVLSQKHEGWQALPSRYDDGGFSGGTMERPGLKKLLTDIAAGKVQTVVVYKVDRLTRSLADFAKIVESFDSKGVSFVSVTQQFNTTSSMGRLTLNVLLSFAQFEREVTGERIRDKVAASKRKGLWMGGQVPLGYDLGHRELVVNQMEAEQVREIYRQYLRLKSVFDLQEFLKTTAIRSKRRVSSAGRSLGGSVLSRGTLYHLLRSPLYLGKIVHKGKTHPGLHQPIVDQALWDEVARQLDSAGVERRRPKNLASRRLLTGLLFTEAGERYVPTHASKKGRRYFYYTCPDTVDAPRRLPAIVVEELILNRLTALLSEPTDLRTLYPDLSVSELQLIVAAGRHTAELLEDTRAENTRAFLCHVIAKVNVDPRSLKVEVQTSALLKELLGREVSGYREPYSLECPLLIDERGAATKLTLATQRRTTSEPRLLLLAVARARAWSEQIARGEITSLDDLVHSSQLSRRYVQRTLRCGALSPNCIQQIAAGGAIEQKTLWELSAGMGLDWKLQAL